MNPKILTLVLVAVVSSAPAAEPTLGPVVDGYGPTYLVADRDVPLPEDFEYRVVLDAARAAAGPSDLDATFVSAARFLNMHARNEVPVDRMALAVVVHGAALQSILSDEAYRDRHGVGNPNLELLNRLRQAGVRVFVCGQSMAFNDIDKADLWPHAEVALSAMTMMAILQSRGYALIP